MEHNVKNPNKYTNSTVFKNETGCDLFIRGEDWFVSGDVTAEQAQALLDAHNPPASTEPTVAEKLASVGLSIEELKAALGGN
jgi:hypothetical protein